MHDLPIGLYPSVAKEIMQIVGVVDEDGVELDDSNFQRYRVEVDISKPLCRGRKITLHDGKEWWVSFKYERLPKICYWYGKLTHSDRECPIWLKSKKGLKEEDKQFGPWLQAFASNLSRKIVVQLSGCCEEDSGDEDQNFSDGNARNREIGRASCRERVWR